MEIYGNLPSSSLSHWKAGDEDPPFGAGLWRCFLGEWGRRPSDQGKEFIRNTTTVVTPVHLYIEGPPNPPSAPGGRPHRTPTLLLGPHHVFTPSHWNCPSTTLSSRSFSDGRAIQKTSLRKARVSSAGW
jgi:hypothetical protein